MRYTSLLLAMAALLVLVPPLTVSGWGAELAFGLSLAVLCGGALAASEPPHLRSPAVWLLPLPLLAAVLVRAVGSPEVLVAARVANTVYLAVVATLILRHVLSQERPTADAVWGGVCGYLLLGLIFHNVFCMLEIVSPGTFQIGGEPVADLAGARHPLGQYQDLLYYSFVTLSTLGYGDVLPTTAFARSLAAAEAVVGQLYLAILVAGLVGLHLAQRQNER